MHLIGLYMRACGSQLFAPGSYLWESSVNR